MGLDLSINSTGICIYDNKTHQTVYYIIGSKFTKKALDTQQSIVSLYTYCKTNINKDDTYHIKEMHKTYNIYNIVEYIKTIIRIHMPETAVIEGVAFNASGDVIGLAGLNYMVRKLLIDEGINPVVISPTSNKKFATGNGQAEKDIMISAWHKSDPKTIDIPACIKVDDIADAYFLARYGEYLKTS